MASNCFGLSAGILVCCCYKENKALWLLYVLFMVAYCAAINMLGHDRHLNDSHSSPSSTHETHLIKEDCQCQHVFESWSVCACVCVVSSATPHLCHRPWSQRGPMCFLRMAFSAFPLSLPLFLALSLFLSFPYSGRVFLLRQLTVCAEVLLSAVHMTDPTGAHTSLSLYVSASSSLCHPLMLHLY